MILFLEFISQRHRGGEIYIGKLHSFLKANTALLLPNELEPMPENLRSFREREAHCFELVEESNPKIVIADISSSTCNYRAIKKLKSRGGQLVLIVQSDPPSNFSKTFFKKVLTGMCEKYMMKNADIMICNSEYTTGITSRYRKLDCKVVIAPPGMQTSPQTNQELVGDKRNPFRLLYVGEISRVKGLKYLIEAIALLGQIDFTLDIVGGAAQEPYYMKQVESLVAEYSLFSKIKFRGYCDRETLDHLYEISSLLVVPSIVEGYGMTVAEALCFGLPVVASNTGGIPEVLGNSGAAILVPPADRTALADAIRKLYEDPAACSRMSQAAFERSSQISNWSDFDEILSEQLIPSLTSNPE